MRDRPINLAQINAAKQLIVAYVMLFIQMAVFYVSAGYLGEQPWLFFGASFLHYSVSTFVQYTLCPELLAVRLKRKLEESKVWDEVLMRVTNLIALIAVPAIAGWDLGRLHGVTLAGWFIVLGLVLFALSTIVLDWAMVVNPHFEPTFRIQADRGHTVITTGPYTVVRHPGHLAGILYILSIPLIMGSLYAFIPVGIYILFLLLRTPLEDRTLCRELDGYTQYAEKVRYRLFPWLW